MIIYFSATGNSRYVATQLAADEERIIFIPDAIDQEIYEYNVEPNENVGIISPTYNWTIPSIVEEFLEKLKLNYSTKPYIYYVGTFGTTTGAAAAMANRYMKSKGCPFDAMFDVRMSDTWTPTFNLSDKEHVKQINNQADVQILQLQKAVSDKITGKHMHITMPYAAGVIGKHIYDSKTRCPKFAIQCGKKTKLHGQYQHS